MLPVPIRQTGEKKGSKRHILVDGRGVPLSLIVTGANRHDVSQLAAVLDAIIVPLPKETPFLYADKGYSGEPAQRSDPLGLHSPGYPKETQTRPSSQEQTLGRRSDTLLVQPLSEVACQI